MNRFMSNLYTVERRTWKTHELCLIQNDDFTLFSGHHKTKIVEEDLPEWYVFGRYYKMWGFLSTKGITDLRYIPNLWINHFLKDDCLLISYGGKIEEQPDSSGFEKYSGVDERVWGNEILNAEMSRNVQSGNTQNLKSTVIQRSFPKWSVAERRKTAAASNQAAVCACAHSRYFTGGSPSGLRV